MNIYLYAEATQDFWPEIKKISANSYNDAVEKLIEKYSDQLDDSDILCLNNIEKLQGYLNDEYTIAISDLQDYESI